MRLARKAVIALASLVVCFLGPSSARAQTLAAPGVASGSDAVSAFPTLFGDQEAPCPEFASMDARTFFRLGGQPTVSALGMNPTLPRNASAFTAFGISPLFILDFTRSAYAWSTPAWNDDLRLWINGFGDGARGRADGGVVTFGSSTPLYALHADVSLEHPSGDKLRLGLR